MPAPRSAVSAEAGVRKWKSLGAGSPRVVIAVSRFTMARSAPRRPAVAAPNAVAGWVSSDAVRSMKCTSPANANVNSPDGRAGLDGAGADATGRVVGGGETEPETDGAGQLDD